MPVLSIKLSIIILALSLFVPNIVLAAEETGLTISPAIVDIASNPGVKTNKTIKIFNNSSLPAPVQVSAKSLLPSDEIIDPNKLKNFDASKWITFNKDTYAVESFGSIDINYNVNIPKEAAPGGHYAEIVVSSFSLGVKDNIQSGAQIVPEVKAPILINVSGDVKEELSVQQQQILPLFIQKDRNITSNITLINSGNTHLLPTVTIELIKNNQVVHKEVFSSLLILPNTIKDYKFVWSTDQNFGIYDSKVNITYGQKGQSINQQRSVLIIPNVWIIISVLIGFLACLFLIKNRKNIKQSVRILLKG